DVGIVGLHSGSHSAHPLDRFFSGGPTPVRQLATGGGQCRDCDPPHDALLPRAYGPKRQEFIPIWYNNPSVQLVNGGGPYISYYAFKNVIDFTRLLK
ncbi:MAG TPA: hypothetical protein VJH75_01320, partial [Patescibacteria group bacterium]|nr:hypothetical protein [Patescibacteria group bacterium]